MGKIACVAICCALWGTQQSPQNEESKSDDAGYVLMECGATMVVMEDPFYLGGKPKLPILDKTGRIHPGSCNPSFELNSPKFNKPKLKLLLFHLKTLRPEGHASHVAIYLSKDIFKDKAFLKQLQKELPMCRIYRHSRDQALRDIDNSPSAKENAG